MMKMRQDIYARVTDNIVASLEQGVRPWVKPWTVQHAAGRITRPLRHNGIPYRGINVLLLWSEAVEKGYAAPLWLTFKQALHLKGHVRKGERGSMVVYTERVTRTRVDDAGEEVEKEIPFLKSYVVFNADQIDGLPEQFYARPAPRTDAVPRIARAEAFFARTDAFTVHGGSQACYRPPHDRIHLPCIDAFKDAESYYATRAHECIHWTGHPSRLARQFGCKRWGDEGYAVEELVAELGAAFLCADLDITAEPRDDHAAYLSHWLKVLKQDRRAIFSAASCAQRACDYLHGLQPQLPKEAAA
jgi:antirestriction protein ArdC